MTATQVYEILGIVGLGLASAIGVLLAALQLPGTWIIFCAAVVYDWAYDWQRMGPTALAVFGGLVVGAEILDQVSGMVLTGRAGGSKRASWGGLIGGIAGMFLFTFPVPVIGTIAGGCSASAPRRLNSFAQTSRGKRRGESRWRRTAPTNTHYGYPASRNLGSLTAAQRC